MKRGGVGGCCGRLKDWRFGSELRSGGRGVFEDEIREDGDGGSEGWDDEFAGVHNGFGVDWSWVRTVGR